VAQQLNVDPDDLMALRAPPWPSWFRYRPIQRRKRGGAIRRIRAPSPKLKALQRAMLRGYLERLPVHPAAMGFRKGLSAVDNARRHAGQRIVITADIEDFFDHTTVGRIEALFRTYSWDTTTAAILTRLCTFHGALPQGAPTSPVLSNLVNVQLDAALSRRVLRSGGIYTRYGDDLTFSWKRPEPLSHFEREVRRLLLDQGYRLNRRKGWRVYDVQRGDKPKVTGILLGWDGRLHPSPEIQRTMRRLRRQIRDDPKAAARLRGYQGFVDSLG
jgi:retron-type reverse transcriptase